MRTTAVLAGLALIVGLAVPAVAQMPGIAPAAETGMGSGRDGQRMQAPGRPGGWQHRGGGHSQGRRGRSFVGMLLRHRQELGLTTQQVDSLRKLGMDSRRAAIRRNADVQVARLDLMGLRMSDTVDMGKVEAKVREIERLRGDGSIARIRTAVDAKAQLTPEQREKLKSLWAARGQRRGGGEGGMDIQDAPEQHR